MSLLFVTGGNAPFFNSLLVCLQSFAERLPGERLLVCDYGLSEPQAEFLRGLGLLLERPPELATRDVFCCKAALLRYLDRNRMETQPDTVVWLDGDLTLMDVSVRDFQTVATAMMTAEAGVAACGEPSGKNIAAMIGSFADASALAPFADVVAAANIDAASPYFSSGLFFCSSPDFLTRWCDLTLTMKSHPLFEQNMFNVALYRDRVPHLTLDCEEWQAQGQSLSRVELRDVPGQRAAAFIGNKSIKTLHATSPGRGHLLIAECRLTVLDLDLTGTFKLFMAEPLRLHQIQLLASFILAHRDALTRLGICTPALRRAEGFSFETLPAR